MKKIIVAFLIPILFFIIPAKAEMVKKQTMAARSLDTYTKMNKLAAMGNNVALVEMLGKNEVCYIPEGAEVKIIDSVNFLSHNVKKVKVIKVNDYYRDYLQGTFWIDEYWLE